MRTQVARSTSEGWAATCTCGLPCCSGQPLPALSKQVACRQTYSFMHGLELQAQAARSAVPNGAAAAAQQSSQPSAIDSLTNGAHPSQAEPDTASGAQPLAAASPPDSSAAVAPAANSNGEQVKCCFRNGSDMVQSICRRRRAQYLDGHSKSSFAQQACHD